MLIAIHRFGSHLTEMWRGYCPSLFAFAHSLSTPTGGLAAGLVAGASPSSPVRRPGRRSRERVSPPVLHLVEQRHLELAAVHLAARRIRRRRRIRQPLLPCAFGGAALHPGAPLGDLQTAVRRMEKPRPAGGGGCATIADPLHANDEAYRTRPWEQPHRPNLTGTPAASRPSRQHSQPAAGGPVAAAYQPWSPKPWSNLIETAVGALVIAIALGSSFSCIRRPASARAPAGSHLTAAYRGCEGINVGSDVRMSGIKIGSVTAQSLDNQSYDAILDLCHRSIHRAARRFDRQDHLGRAARRQVHRARAGRQRNAPQRWRHHHLHQGALDLWALVSDYVFSGKSKSSDNSGGSSGQDDEAVATDPAAVGTAASADAAATAATAARRAAAAIAAGCRNRGPAGRYRQLSGSGDRTLSGTENSGRGPGRRQPDPAGGPSGQ